MFKYQEIIDQYPERINQIKELSNAIEFGSPLGEILFVKRIIDDDTLIIIEASLETDFSYLDDLGFEIYKTKLYKTNQHVMVKGR